MIQIHWGYVVFYFISMFLAYIFGRVAGENFGQYNECRRWNETLLSMAEREDNKEYNDNE